MTAVVEDLNVLDTVRAEELVAYISARHPGEEPDVPRVDFGITTITGLRVGDSILRVHLDLNLLNNRNGKRFPKKPHVYENSCHMGSVPVGIQSAVAIVHPRLAVDDPRRTCVPLV